MTNPEVVLPSLEQIIDIVHPDRTSQAEVGAYIGSLKKSYDDPSRSHHDFTHVQEMIREYIRYEELVQNLRLLTWSALLHDIFYDPKAAPGVNEEMSAKKGERDLPAFLPHREVSIVAGNVRATAKHSTDSSDEDTQLFLDSDLWVLGSREDRYGRYASDIRQEYAHVDRVTYNAGRIAVLQKLSTRIDGQYVYQTEAFRGDYETRAQHNIARESRQLSGAS